MSYAIIRVEKHKSGNLKLANKHDERKNKSDSNKNIDTTKSHLNYHLKKPKDILKLLLILLVIIRS